MQRVKYLFTQIGWGNVAHLWLSISVPLAVLLFIELELTYLAVASVLASKWRVIAVQPRHWLANFRANSADLIVNLSFVVLLEKADMLPTILLWLAGYIAWLIWLKPQSKDVAVGAQSLVTLFLGLTALFWLSNNLNELALVIVGWFIGLTAARHYMSHFEEPLLRVMSFAWAFFVAQIIWILNRWLVTYQIATDLIIPQPAIVLTVVAYVLGSLFYLDKTEKLQRIHVRSYIGSASAIIFMIIILTDWSATAR